MDCLYPDPVGQIAQASIDVGFVPLHQTGFANCLQNVDVWGDLVIFEFGNILQSLVEGAEKDVEKPPINSADVVKLCERY